MQFFMENLKKKRDKAKKILTFWIRDLKPRFLVIFPPMIWIFMWSEEPNQHKWISNMGGKNQVKGSLDIDFLVRPPKYWTSRRIVLTFYCLNKFFYWSTNIFQILGLQPQTYQKTATFFFTVDQNNFQNKITMIFSNISCSF